MNSKRTIPVTEARKRIFEILEDIHGTEKEYTLTHNGKPRAVILDVAAYESLLETIDVLSVPGMAKNIQEVDTAIRTGQWKKWGHWTPSATPTSEAAYAAEKPKKTYGIRTRAISGSKKKSR